MKDQDLGLKLPGSLGIQAWRNHHHAAHFRMDDAQIWKQEGTPDLRDSNAVWLHALVWRGRSPSGSRDQKGLDLSLRWTTSTWGRLSQADFGAPIRVVTEVRKDQSEVSFQPDLVDRLELSEWRKGKDRQVLKWENRESTI